MRHQGEREKNFGLRFIIQCVQCSYQISTSKNLQAFYSGNLQASKLPYFFLLISIKAINCLASIYSSHVLVEVRECSLFIPGVGTEEKWVGFSHFSGV